MLKILTNRAFSFEKKYLFHVLFSSFLGVAYELYFDDGIGDLYRILFADKQIEFEDAFFAHLSQENYYQSQENIPQHIAFGKNPFTPEKDIPILYGHDQCQFKDKRIYCGIDIFASSFFMLSRWEEYANSTRDQHNRFPASVSLAYRHGFLLRPIVNEYVEMLWNMLTKLGYDQPRKSRQFEVKVSHDIDVPYRYAFQPFYTLPRSIAGELLRRREWGAPFSMPWQYAKSRFAPEKCDPYYTFDQIMDISEAHNLVSAFYFIADHSAGKIDGDYDIFHPRIQQLMKHIADRGHEIGVHGSYNSYNDLKQYQRELDRLKQSCQKVGIEQSCWGSRQHFLRWHSPQTPQLLNEASVDYDTTCGYADHIGFRCGTCYEFPMFDFQRKEMLSVVQRPLILMECSLLDKRYMHLPITEALQLGLQLKSIVEKYHGLFTLLWHNTRFLLREEVKIYKTLLSSNAKKDL